MRHSRIAVLGAALLIGSSLVAACGSGTQNGQSAASGSSAEAAAQLYATSTVALAADGASSPLKVGVIVGPVEGAGSEFRPLVEGANLAARRFALSGMSIDLSVALDDGTPSGAKAAMESLIAAGVSGILIESPLDSHMADAVAVASASKTALIALYSPSSGLGTWSVAPSSSAISDAISESLEVGGATKPFVVTGAGRTAPITGSASAAMTDLDAVAAQIKSAYESRQVDSIVINGSAAEQSALVAKLEGALNGAPALIVLTPEALTPSFASAVFSAGASEGRLVVVGRRPADASVLGSDEAGNAASAFFTAMRLGVGDDSCQNIYKDANCADALPWADVESHDALIALVRAAQTANSGDPAKVSTALASLTLSIDDGLAGAPLDFRNADALPSSAVVPLRASASNTGARPALSDGRQVSPFFWFAE